METPKQKIRMIALDLDGTLLNSKKEITATTLQTLQRAIQRGIEVVVATGRPRVGLPDAVAEIPGIRYAVLTNGAAVCRLRDGAYVFHDCMERGETAEFLRRTRSLYAVQGVFVGDWGYMEAVDALRIEKLDLARQMKDYLLASRKVVPSLPEFLHREMRQPQKVVINFFRDACGAPVDRAQCLRIADEFEQFSYVSGGVGNIEVTRAGTGKGTALVKLGASLGIAPEEIMAIGDSENDLEMIRKAGLGVAMANSEAVLLAAADVCTASNDADGVAAAICTYALGE